MVMNPPTDRGGELDYTCHGTYWLMATSLFSNGQVLEVLVVSTITKPVEYIYLQDKL